VLATALRPLNALVSASGHSQLVAAKADAAQRAEQSGLGREAYVQMVQMMYNPEKGESKPVCVDSPLKRKRARFRCIIMSVEA
jgi:hypothetical protein